MPRSRHDQRLILNRRTIDHSIVLPAATFIDRHLAIGRITEADYEDLLTHVFVKLKLSKVLRNGRWVKMKIDPRPEDAVFAPLQSLADTIHDFCLDWDKGQDKLGKATARMKYDPSRVLHCDYLEQSAIKTHAHFFLVESSTSGAHGDQAPLVDLASVGRFRKLPNSDNRPETEMDLVAAASLILEADPCRRFTNAFTIEGTRMKFWHFSRSHVAISDDFDFHKDAEHFIRFVIFMTFASREELGYDPTVKRVQDVDGYTQYQFHIGDKIYQTLRSLAELHEINTICAAPRVWAVTELDAETKAPIGETMVLKDFWAYAGSKSELEIQTGILNALRKLDEDGVPADQLPPGSSGLLAEDAKKFFLHIVGDAPVQINGVDDNALAPDNKSTLMHYAAAYGVPNMPQHPSRPQHATKVHRRIIFEEECQTMWDLSDYADCALAMAQLIQGLNYMRLAGYTHHDISPGNCLIHESADGQRQLKISDLEYAQPYSAPVHETGQFGTPGFLPVEYEYGQHLYRPRTARPHVFFRYNFAHDLEAALWIYAWFVFNMVPSSLNPSASLKAAKYYRDELLEKDESPLRCAFLTEGHVAGQEAVKVALQLYHRVPEGDTIVSGLLTFNAVVDLYKRVEASEPLHVGVKDMTRWDPRCFLQGHYVFLQAQFMDIHHRLVGVRYGAVAHEDFECAAAAAQRAEKRAREDSKVKVKDEEDELVAKKLCVRATVS